MSDFVYTTAPSRVIFGTETLIKLPEVLSRQGSKAAVILCTPQQTDLAARVQILIEDTAVGVFKEATMHTPTDMIQKALSYASGQKADCIISAGGGSTIGLEKAISIRTGLPHICIPTTYAGSEMTPILGETVNGLKPTRRDPKILPGTVIYDDPVARYSALYGSWLCGICLGNTTIALHHKLCHTLGGSFDLAHAETHAIVLPHALAYNAPYIPDVMATLADAIPGSEGDAVRGLNVLLRRLGVKRALRDFGVREEDVERAARIATENPYGNPRPAEFEG
ncbi:Dehydroquinate synthase-like protein [Aulographum hederae CBS 113979]|uniref:Dehydroquinate synthase-like protein n=1 Tax=Aulographum hederae CBS 113979 TaxID=1176131 RepID=A0A6G1GQ44_9PEZI|nr:Dehydroquinate synthase-like protein [Aulographum hederae CBS 113979]